MPNGKYPPSFTVKVPVYDGRVSTEIVDAQRNPVYATPDTLASIFPKGVECNLVVSGSVYVIAGGGFGVTWRLQTAQVFPRARLTAADIFSEEPVEATVEATADATEPYEAAQSLGGAPGPAEVVEHPPPARKRRSAAP